MYFMNLEYIYLKSLAIITGLPCLVLVCLNFYNIMVFDRPGVALQFYTNTSTHSRDFTEGISIQCLAVLQTAP